MRIQITFALLAAFAAATTVAARAEDAGLKTAGYKLKNRSAFALPENTRAPFWPIGWEKPRPGEVTQQQPVEAAVVAKLDPEQFSVTSILVGRPSIAVINGKAYSEGEFIRAAKAGAKATTGVTSLPPGTRVRIARVADGAVLLELNGQLTQLAMKRPELQLENRANEDEGADLLKPISER